MKWHNYPNLSLRPARPAFRCGPVQRRARRALLALGTASTSTITQWTHRRPTPGITRSTRRALEQIGAVRVGRVPPYGAWLWRLRDSHATNITPQPASAGEETNMNKRFDERIRQDRITAVDRRWFAAHPRRSHRLRSALAGEWPISEPPPAGHALQVIVRQLQPGARTRLPFFRDLSAVIPDAEPILHALFDLVQGKGGGSRLSAQELIRLARERAHRPLVM